MPITSHYDGESTYTASCLSVLALNSDNCYEVISAFHNFIKAYLHEWWACPLCGDDADRLVDLEVQDENLTRVHQQQVVAARAQVHQLYALLQRKQLPRGWSLTRQWQETISGSHLTKLK